MFLLTCLNPLYIHLISCLVNCVLIIKSWRSTWCLFWFSSILAATAARIFVAGSELVILFSLLCIICAIQASVLCIIYTVFCFLHSISYIMYSVLCFLYSEFWILYSVYYGLYFEFDILYGVMYILYSVVRYLSQLYFLPSGYSPTTSYKSLLGTHHHSLHTLLVTTQNKFWSCRSNILVGHPKKPIVPWLCS